jgi:hypothetical protein
LALDVLAISGNHPFYEGFPFGSRVKLIFKMNKI